LAEVLDGVVKKEEDKRNFSSTSSCVLLEKESRKGLMRKFLFVILIFEDEED
jgi:hypothetical protein